MEYDGVRIVLRISRVTDVEYWSERLRIMRESKPTRVCEMMKNMKKITYVYVIFSFRVDLRAPLTIASIALHMTMRKKMFSLQMKTATHIFHIWDDSLISNVGISVTKYEICVLYKFNNLL